MSQNVKELIQIFQKESEIFLTIQPENNEAAPLRFGEVTEYIRSLNVENPDFSAVKRAFKKERGKPVCIGRSTEGGRLTEQSLFALEVSEDLMICWLTLFPPNPDTSLPEIKQILGAMNAEKISFGIQEEAISEALEKKEFNNKKLVARGLFPEAGKDASIKPVPGVYNDMKSFMSEYQDVGKFRNSQYILPVSENDVIAELERETPGKIGRTVYGKEIETLSGAPLERAGTNIFMSEKNIFANAEGSVFKDCGGLHVEPLLSLKGVTNREINHNGSVKILGDVESCPMIQASGDIEIHGTVNNTKMRAGRSLVIHGNLFTKPDKPIVAGQNFLGQNVSNAVVTAQNIVITATSFNSTLTAYDTIQNLGPEGKIVGGVCFAGAAVFASGLGSSTSIPTTISVSTVEGVKKHKKEMVSYYLRKAEELKNHFFLLEGKMERIEKLERALPIEARPAYKPMRKSIEELTEKCELRLDGIQQKAAEINGAGRKNRGEIHAKKIFPNVTLLMGNQKREIRDTQTDIHLYVKGAEIFSEPV